MVKSSRRYHGTNRQNTLCTCTHITRFLGFWEIRLAKFQRNDSPNPRSGLRPLILVNVELSVVADMTRSQNPATCHCVVCSVNWCGHLHAWNLSPYKIRTVGAIHL